MLAQSLQELRQQVALRERYDNFIGGKWVPPVKGQYFDNVSPITGKPFCQVARSTAEDIELALDAAHAAREAWGNTAPAQRARLLNKIAARLEGKLSLLALAETIDNGKPIRETTAADVPLVIDHFPLFRRLHPRAGRQPLRTRPHNGRLSFTMSRSASSARSSPGTSRC